MKIPSEEMIESVLSEHRSHANDDHNQFNTCELCSLIKQFDDRNQKMGGRNISALDEMAAIAIHNMKLGDILIDDEEIDQHVQNIIDLYRFTFFVGIKIGRRQATEELTSEVTG